MHRRRERLLSCSAPGPAGLTVQVRRAVRAAPSWAAASCAMRCSYSAWKLISARWIGGKPARVIASAMFERRYGNRMVGQAMPTSGSIWSAGMLRISKMPACLASIRNATLSDDLRGDRARDQHFEDAFREALGLHVDFDFHRRHFLLEEDARRIRLLERHVLQVDALDVEERLVVVVRHGDDSLDYFDGRRRACRSVVAAASAARRVHSRAAPECAFRPIRAAASGRPCDRARRDRRSRRRASRR